MAFDSSFNNGTESVNVLQQFTAGKPSTQNSEKEFKKAKYWLNIGVRSSMTDSQGQPIFIQIGTGIAFDNVELKNAKGESFTAQIGECHDEIVKALQGMFQKLPDGKRVIVEGLEVQAYKVPDQPVENTKPAISVDEALKKIQEMDIPF